MAGRIVRDDAFDRIIAALEQYGSRTKHDKPGHVMAQCPAHPDRNPSLSVTRTDSQALVHCFTGCHHEDILAAIGLEPRDVYNDATDGPFGMGEAIRYRYPDGRENWRSTKRKDFRRDDRAAVDHPGGKLLYRSDLIGDAADVYVCEGEKDADAVAAVGGAAVGCPGSTSPAGYDWTPLRGRRVVIIADRDEAGDKYAYAVADLLRNLAESVRIARPAEGKDAADHVAAAHALAELVVEDPEAELRKATVRRYPSLDLDTILDPNRPPREYVVAGLLPAGAAVTLTAPAGTGKSLLSLAIALAVARGHRHIAELGIPKPRRVLYVDMENTPDDLAERFESFGIRRGDSLGRLTYLSLPSLPPLDTREGGNELGAIVRAYGLAAGDLVVIDSLQRVIEGEENAADTMRAYYLHTGIHLKRAGLTSLRLDNTGKDVTRGSRGTSGKRDDVDLELVMVPDAEDDEKFMVTINKTRLSDIAPLTLTRYVDRAGRTQFSTRDDRHRTAVNAAKEELDRRGIPVDATVTQARDALASRGFIDATIRTAVRERRGAPTRQPVACTVCGERMADVGDGSTTHPGCEDYR